MNPLYIVISMFSVLGILFIISPYLQRHEKKRTELERCYFDLLKEFHRSDSDVISQEIKRLVIELFHLTTEQDIKEKVKSDLKIMGI